MKKSITNLNKKGNLFDFLEVGNVLLIIVIMGFIAFIILSNFSTKISVFDTEQNNYSQLTNTALNRTTTSLDWGSLLFLISALIFSIIMAKKIPTDPKYITIVLLISFVFFIASFIIANIFGSLMDNSQIASYMNLRMPITLILLKYFPYVVAIYEAIVLIVFFGKDEQI